MVVAKAYGGNMAACKVEAHLNYLSYGPRSGINETEACGGS